MTIEIFHDQISRMLATWQWSNLQPPDHQLDGHPTEKAKELLGGIVDNFSFC